MPIEWAMKERFQMSVPGQVMLREISEIPRMLGDIANAISSNQSAKNLLRDRNFDSVIILARGTSDNAGHYLKYLLETQLGLPVGLASPSAATMYTTSFKYQNCLLIAISQSGQSTDLLTFAKAAQAGGGYLLSITNDENSPLAKLSDLHVDSIINAASSIVDDQSDYKSFAKHLDISKPIYVLGRGFSYPNAKEFALKLQETCLIPVQGMSSSDFLHGPIASLNSEAQVVFTASEHLPKESFGEAPQRVRNVTGKVLWIGNPAITSNEDVLFKAAHTPSELTASISDAVAFQKITHELATSNGLNPDSPEGLSKVTITR